MTHLHILYRIKLMHISIRDWARNLYYGLQNLLQYAPLIWKDRDWDYSYLLGMLDFKLRRIYKQLDENSNEEKKSLGRKLDKLQEVLDILERIRKDKYLNKEWVAYYQKYPFKWGRVSSSETTQRTYSPAQVKQLRALFKKEQALILQDWNRLFLLIKNNLKGWWD